MGGCFIPYFNLQTISRLIRTSKDLCQFFNRAEVWQTLLEKYFPPLVRPFSPDVQNAPKLLFRLKVTEQKLAMQKIAAQKQLEQRSYRDYGIH